MKYTDLNQDEIVELFESFPSADYNLVFRLFKSYYEILYTLNQAFENIAYQRDLYDVMTAFYPQKQMTYQHFCRIIKELESETLIKIDKGKQNVIRMARKGFTLLGQNRADIPKSRGSKLSLRKAHTLAKTHLLGKDYFKKYNLDYHFDMLEQCEKHNHIYKLQIENNVFLFYMLLFDFVEHDTLNKYFKDFNDDINYKGARVVIIGETAGKKHYVNYVNQKNQPTSNSILKFMQPVSIY